MAEKTTIEKPGSLRNCTTLIPQSTYREMIRIGGTVQMSLGAVTRAILEIFDFQLYMSLLSESSKQGVSFPIYVKRILQKHVAGLSGK